MFFFTQTGFKEPVKKVESQGFEQGQKLEKAVIPSVEES
jgi:hypothetical protein